MKQHKMLTSALIVTGVLGGLVGCGARESSSSESGDAGKGSEIMVGSAIYKFDDTFMTGVRTAMSAEAENQGVTLELVDSQNKQPTQNEQVDTFITKGVNALAINAVDRTAAGPIVEKAKAKELPIVFLNREPEEDIMNSYDKVWYVGAKAEQSGTLSGEIIVDYFNEHKEADKNGDGKIQYVMLQGEPGHQDATLRSEYSIKAIEDAGYEAEKLAADTAMWDKAKATDLMKSFITGQGLDKIEAIIANNDDMALGAVEALKAEGYNKGDASKYIPVVGVDATAPALQAMKDGSLLGTVLNDAENQGKATINVAKAAVEGKEVNEEAIGYPVTDDKYVWIDYVKVTVDNYEEYMK
ncbi:galactose ABC transporter substrate-binding protein [Vagococcus xieshaowenii]|uniref:D-galactose/methyl-galactoside binding periplasmic protein MglB n=1 Tax=Vagococcus xieshaowenii TaxID=2562451 RepID=A0A4Z0D6N9_9ENTE|nr:galactose ABC transporter substrate-binding protein [Vagococcus xieshaowenii]QCA28647.1 galactose/glucose ABC transporter substrate-binding protein MglB [Vagococcus xieshaowenii]TFZ40545.1 galactose/glucose ABC transporter substrate-binding protein MglB [Vagococcus xieshaowenii]